MNDLNIGANMQNILKALLTDNAKLVVHNVSVPENNHKAFQAVMVSMSGQDGWGWRFWYDGNGSDPEEAIAALDIKLSGKV
jgi:hypothetical protein